MYEEKKTKPKGNTQKASRYKFSFLFNSSKKEPLDLIVFCATIYHHSIIENAQIILT